VASESEERELLELDKWCMCLQW